MRRQRVGRRFGGVYVHVLRRAVRRLLCVVGAPPLPPPGHAGVRRLLDEAGGLAAAQSDRQAPRLRCRLQYGEGAPRAGGGGGGGGGGGAARDENRAKLRAANAEAAEAAARDELLKGGSGAGGRSGGGGAGAAPSKQVAGANAAAGEAVDALRERGEKLGILGDKVADLAREAEDFAAQARKLREKAEKQAGWFPF